jgi:hypothetical protein
MSKKKHIEDIDVEKYFNPKAKEMDWKTFLTKVRHWMSVGTLYEASDAKIAELYEKLTGKKVTVKDKETKTE